ncbi:transmembrane protein [Legionella gratiana]|uniref:Transmembrane protein n=1 Tax=Legionella gratiana TaxID=45066 RepID=A0A378J6B3_9GAMM|nr:site-2 protease family protein [Legionella gratiana]KTD06156.1 transmembrane protein [Legionella gratiana]STX42979.1 transmembrane protein [Legionella gratiana]
MLEFTLIQKVCIWAIPILLAITLHEAAHAFVAYRCGDTTAKMFGRLSLNPIRHIDPIGTVMIPLIVGILTQFNFVIGYAKPVPINWNQLRHPRRDMILVTLAGPFANIFMAFLWAGCYKISLMLNPSSSMPVLFLYATAQAGMLINLILAALNLLPIPPLDGSRVVSSLLRPRQALAYEKIEPYGFIILLILVFTGALGFILTPLINLGLISLSAIFNI